MTGSPLARVNVGADAWDLIWSFAQRVLVVNAGLAVASAPLLVALAVVGDPLSYPVFFGFLALCLGPALAASFAYLDDQGTFVQCYRRLARRVLLPWALTLAVLSILMTDIVVLYDDPRGAALVPLLVLLAIVAVSTGLTRLGYPSIPFRTALYATVRKPHLTALSLVVLAVAAVIVNQFPLAGLATVPGCAVWVVQLNARIALDRSGA
ncbi:hypothetical protein ACIBL3_40295 [Kribbella sp. NPDC050124]|uniref:hypothetical protein n=1 Tax=Kribbella sp. NPDC050124 TaxID=3364114 RepID=UPI0037B6D063